MRVKRGICGLVGVLGLLLRKDGVFVRKDVFGVGQVGR